MKKEDLETFNQALQETQTPVSIVMHDVPDPDAMGSAMGLQFILKLKGIDSEVYYRGDISHPQNKTLVNVLSISGWTKLADNEKIDDDLPVFVVDGTEQNSCATKPFMVIDHHKNKSQAKHQIVSHEFGACSTIVWELFKSIFLTPESDGIDLDESANIFTTLLLGIRTDTNDLTSENMIKNDFVAYQELLELSDKEALQKVMNYPFPRYLYDNRLSLHNEGNFAEKNGVFVGGVGFIPSTQRDVIAILSEEYARMETVNTAIIFAIVGKATLQVSIRSSNVSLDVGAMCREIFGEFGGGTSYKGGASIPLTFYTDLENGEKEKFWNVTCTHMFRKVFKEAWVEEPHDE